MADTTFRTGFDNLMTRHGAWWGKARIGLVAHAASVNSEGLHSAEWLAREDGAKLAALFGPEHGFWSRAAAGETVAEGRHPDWGIPVHSLYGDTKSPTEEMLKDIDVLIFDMQNLPVRCYTYISTLRLVMEAAAQSGRTLIVADRPAPLANVCEGPALDPALTSFVGLVPSPFVYGLTPAEAALWLKAVLRLDLDLKVAAMEGYRRDDWPGAHWPAWVPPSPAIRSWESALCYPATVFCEALPALPCGRNGPLAFQIFGAEWMKGAAFAAYMNSCGLPGVLFEPFAFPHGDETIDGVRLHVTAPSEFRPVRTAVTLLCAVSALYDTDAVWTFPGTREDFFDRLMGSAEVRRQLKDGDPASSIATAWEPAARQFRDATARFRLYA